MLGPQAGTGAVCRFRFAAAAGPAPVMVHLLVPAVPLPARFSSSSFRRCEHHACGSVSSRCTACRAAKQPQHQGRKREQAAAAADLQDDLEGAIVIDDEDEDFLQDEDEDFEADGILEDEEDWQGTGISEDPGPELLTGNVAWGDAALKVARAVLDRPENSSLNLYLFRVLVPTKTIEVRLDRLDDVYGSPDMDDIERFSRALMQGLEAELGTEAAGDIAVEVSSPGAERTLIIPQDMARFKELPMRVEYVNDVGHLTTMILMFVDMDEASDFTTWELADVKANQIVKGRSLSKKQRTQRYSIRMSQLQRVRIYVDF
eukprot:GHRR01030416.1.p1 GENE.GHRR01030416.1~~GHRR01030416.1.p1  ORF type:complete len:317 (+),score=84.42 GHRR01030416.1:336-1286(+)